MGFIIHAEIKYMRKGARRPGRVVRKERQSLFCSALTDTHFSYLSSDK